MVTRILSAVVLAPLFFVVLFFLPPVFLAVLLACITAWFFCGGAHRARRRTA